MAPDFHVPELIAAEPELGRELTTRFVAVMGGRLQAARHRLAELYAYPDHQGGPPQS